jgi:hypothetical protein
MWPRSFKKNMKILSLAMVYLVLPGQDVSANCTIFENGELLTPQIIHPWHVRFLRVPKENDTATLYILSCLSVIKYGNAINPPKLSIRLNKLSLGQCFIVPAKEREEGRPYFFKCEDPSTEPSTEQPINRCIVEFDGKDIPPFPLEFSKSVYFYESAEVTDCGVATGQLGLRQTVIRPGECSLYVRPGFIQHYQCKEASLVDAQAEGRMRNDLRRSKQIKEQEMIEKEAMKNMKKRPSPKN